MNRRTVLAGSCLSVTTLIAGCLDGDGDDPDEAETPTDGDDEPAEDEPTDAVDETDELDETDETAEDDEGEPDEPEPVDETACETGKDLIEAVVAGEYELALEFAPEEHFADLSRDDFEYDVIAKPEEAHVIDCETHTSGRVVIGGRRQWTSFLNEETDADVGEAAILEYPLELEAGATTYDSHLRVNVVELDGDWYAWFYDELFPRPHAVVSIDGDRTDSVSLTLEDVVGGRNAASADGVYVRGDSIADPSGYVLEGVGDSLTVAADSEGAGGYDVVAYIGDGPDDNYAETVIDDFSVIEIDEEAWEDVHEIELEGPTMGWVGASPEQIEGITNPPLYLVEGREYELTWINPDGAHHNIALVDENDDIVDDYETEIISGEGESQTLTFTATPEISQYICLPHPETKRGDVKFL